MSWYKFWKKSGPTASYAEEYLWLEKEDYPNREAIKSECERWAESMPGGHSTHYSYGFQQKNSPPRNVLEKMLRDIEKNENSLAQGKIFLEAELKRVKRNR